MVKTNIPQITRNQMQHMMSHKKVELVEVNGISVKIQPLMFAPKSPYSYSTRVMLNNMNVAGQRTFEPGIGCGVISIYGAKQGAIRADGGDIVPKCIGASWNNSVRNNTYEKTRFFYSDMFSNLDKGSKYDIIISNLPILNGELPDPNPAWYSLFDPGFKCHHQLFSEGSRFAPRIALTHANLRSDQDFDDLEKLAEQYKWKVEKTEQTRFNEKDWRYYEFKYIGGMNR